MSCDAEQGEGVEPITGLCGEVGGESQLSAPSASGGFEITWGAHSCCCL